MKTSITNRVLTKLAKGEQVTIVALGRELDVPVVDHYTAWMKADASHDGPSGTNPNKLWMRMSDAPHPGPAGPVAFFRELAPYFSLAPTLSWEF